MFEHGFPEDWSTIKKLIHLVMAAGGNALTTLTGAIVSFIANAVSPINALTVDINQSSTGCYVNVDSNNLFDKSTASKGYYDNSGTWKTSTSWKVSDYIPVTTGDYVGVGLSVSGSGTAANVYNANQERTRSISIVANQDLNIAVADGEAYVRISVRTGNGEIDTAKFVRRESATFDWQSQAGTISTGTLDVINGTLTTGGNTYQLTGQSMNTLEGSNNIYSDVGDVSVTIPSSILTDENPLVNVGTTDNMVLTE